MVVVGRRRGADGERDRFVRCAWCRLVVDRWAEGVGPPAYRVSRFQARRGTFWLCATHERPGEGPTGGCYAAYKVEQRIAPGAAS